MFFLEVVLANQANPEIDFLELHNMIYSSVWLKVFEGKTMRNSLYCDGFRRVVIFMSSYFMLASAFKIVTESL